MISELDAIVSEARSGQDECILEVIPEIQKSQEFSKFVAMVQAKLLTQHPLRIAVLSELVRTGMELSVAMGVKAARAEDNNSVLEGMFK